MLCHVRIGFGPIFIQVLLLKLLLQVPNAEMGGDKGGGDGGYSGRSSGGNLHFLQDQL